MVDRTSCMPRRWLNVRPAWMERNGLAYWLGYAIHEPRDFAYCAPRRVACRLFGWHNATCDGRRNHPRRW